MNQKDSFFKKFTADKYKSAFYLLIIFHTIFYFIFRILHNAYQAWDSAGHLALSMKFTGLISDFLLGGSTSLMDIITESNYYPPFMQISAAMVNLIFGYHTNLLLFLIFLSFIASLFVLKRLVLLAGFGEKTAFLTVFFYSFFPMIFDQYRLFHLEIPLILFILLCYLFLLKSDFVQIKKFTFLFFLSFGAVQLIKWYGFLFLIVPVLYLLVEGYKRFGVKRLYKNILIGSLIFLIVVLPWYISNLKEFLLLSKVFSAGESDDPQKFLSVENLVFYTRNVLTMQTYLVPFVLFWLGLFSFIKHNKKAGFLLLVQFLIVYLVFTVIKNKNGRYTLALVPGIAFLASYFITRINLKKGLLYAVCAYSVFGFFASSFVQLKNDDPSSNTVGKVLAANFYSHVVDNVDRNLAYDSYQGHIKEVLDDIKADAFIYGIKNIGIMPLIESKSFSTASVEMVRASNKYDKLFIPSPYFIIEPFKNDYEILKYLSDKNVSYLIVPTEIEEKSLRNYKTLMQMIDFVRTNDGTWTDYFKGYDNEGNRIYVYRVRLFNNEYKINSCDEITNWDGVLTMHLEPLSSLVLFTGSFRYQDYYGAFEKNTLRILEINNLSLDTQEVTVTDLPQSGISFCYKKGTKMKLMADIADAFLTNESACGESGCKFVSHVRINEEGLQENYYVGNEFKGGSIQTLLKRSKILPWYKKEGRNVDDLFITGN